MKYSNIDGIKVWQFNEIMNEMDYWSDEVYSMDYFDEILSGGAYEAVRAAFYGGRYGFSQDQFNPNDEYFSFDGYGNLESIPEYYLQNYFNQYEDEILEYVNDNDIELDGVEEDEDI